MDLLIKRKYFIAWMSFFFFVFAFGLSFGAGNHPFVLADEMGYLAAAQYIATGHTLNMSTATFYNFGSSLFYLPAYLFTTDVLVVYQWARFVNAIFYAGLFPLFIYLGRSMFGLELKKSVIISIIIMLYAPLITISWYSSSEVCFNFFFMLLICTVHKLLSKPSIGLALFSGVLAGFLYAIHHKGLLVALVFILTLLLAAFWINKIVLWGLIAFPSLWIVSQVMTNLLDALYTYKNGFNPSAQLLRTLFDFSKWPDLFATFSGHGMYFFMSTVGIGYLGLYLTVKKISFRNATGLTSLLICLSFFACVGASVPSLVNLTQLFAFRLQGRYFDCFIPIFLMAALSFTEKNGMVKWREILCISAVFLAFNIIFACINPNLFGYYVIYHFNEAGILYFDVFAKALRLLYDIPPSFLSWCTVGIAGMFTWFLLSRKNAMWAYRFVAAFLLTSILYYPISSILDLPYIVKHSYIKGTKKELYYTLGKSYENLTAQAPKELPAEIFYPFQLFSNIKLESSDEPSGLYMITKEVTDTPLFDDFYWKAP